MSQLKVNALVSYSGNTVTLGTSGDTINVASGVTFNTASASINYPAGSITDAAISSTAAIQQSKILGSPGFRNIVINGDMQIAQRSTSVASITSGGYFTLDRMRLTLDTLGTWTMSQSTDTPTGQGFANSLKLDCTTADASPAAADVFQFQQRFEGQNLQYLKKGTANAVPLTLSFWVKSTKTGTFIAELSDTDNTRSISKSYTVSVSDTWEKKIITYEGDTTGAFTNDNGQSLVLRLWLGAGTDFTSGALQTTWGAEVAANRAVGQVNIADSTSNEWYITGVQLEAGTTASDFEFLPVDVNLARCQRYYESTSTTEREALSSGRVTSTNTIIQGVRVFKTEKRATPTTSASSTVASMLTVSFGVSSAAGSEESSVTFSLLSKISVRVDFTIASPATTAANSAVVLSVRGDNGRFLIADSEL